MTTKECTLMNFDDRARVIHDSRRQAVMLGIGELKTATLDPQTIEFLTNAMKKNDPLVILERRTDLPAGLSEIFEIMRGLNTADYDEMLTRAVVVLGPGAFGDLRPSRAEIRHKLRLVATRFAYEGVMPEPKQKPDPKPETPIDVEDDVDPDKLDDDLRKQKEAERNRKRDEAAERLTPAQQKMNDKLGVVGADVKALANALEDGERFNEHAARLEKPSRKPRSKKAAPAKPSQTRPAAKASKGSAPAKKSVKRYRS